MKEVNMTVGRFQPFTKGHLKMIADGKAKNGLPTVIMIIQNKKPDSRHPFSDDIIQKELDIVEKNYPDLIEDIIMVTNADIVKNGKALQEKGYQAQLWLCGDDREAPYKKMAENPKYRADGGYPDGFTTYTGTGRTEGVSGTAAREALKAGDHEAFKKIVPKGVDKLFSKFADEISKVNEMAEYEGGLSDYLLSEAVMGHSKPKPRKSPTIVVKTKEELMAAIREAIENGGYGCDLNHIDVSELKDLSDVFYNFRDWDGDISGWDPWQCQNARNMFYGSSYTGQNGDISNWDMRNLVYAGRMFYSSKYDGDISKWDLRSLDVRNSQQFLAACPLAKNRKHWPKKFR